MAAQRAAPEPGACFLPDHQRSPNALNPYGYKKGITEISPAM